MIGPALFVAGGILYVLANYWRERTVPQDGSIRPNRTTALLMLEAVFAIAGAVAVAVVNMVTAVS